MTCQHITPVGQIQKTCIKDLGEIDGSQNEWVVKIKGKKEEDMDRAVSM